MRAARRCGAGRPLPGVVVGPVTGPCAAAGTDRTKSNMAAMVVVMRLAYCVTGRIDEHGPGGGDPDSVESTKLRTGSAAE